MVEILQSEAKYICVYVWARERERCIMEKEIAGSLREKLQQKEVGLERDLFFTFVSLITDGLIKEHMKSYVSWTFRFGDMNPWPAK